MPDVSGARTTGNEGQTQRRIDIQEEILLLEPNSYQLTRVSNLLAKKKTSDPKFVHYEDSSLPRFDAINNAAGYTTSATDLIVDNAAYFQPNDLWKNSRTGEVIRILTTNTGTNHLTSVERGVGNAGTGIAMLDNDELIKIGSAFPENATSRAAVSNNPVQKVNYTQIFRDPVEASRTLLQSDQYTQPHDWVHQNRKLAIEHAKDKESAFLYGKASETLGYTGGPLRTTGGIIPFITTNVTDAGGTFTESEFNTAMRVGSRYQSDSKVAFCSGVALQALQGYPSGKLQVVDQARKEYGLDIQRFRNSFGSIDVIWHKMLDGGVYGGYMVVVDTDGLKYRYLSNQNGSSDTHVRTNIQPNDQDGRKDELLSECGLQFAEEKKHWLVTNISG